LGFFADKFNIQGYYTSRPVLKGHSRGTDSVSQESKRERGEREEEEEEEREEEEKKRGRRRGKEEEKKRKRREEEEKKRGREEERKRGRDLEKEVILREKDNKSSRRIICLRTISRNEEYRPCREN
jgi:hypothetical protein